MDFSVADEGFVNLSIYDIGGHCVSILVENWLEPGEYKVIWNGKSDDYSNQPSGIYFIRYITPSGSITKPIALIK
ncbi:T9SS type A sorting domain-containing protein [bacterium]|nr:T9SS type A sorting domain-containing protein [bacterium]